MSENEKAESKDPIEERIQQLTPEDLEKALKVFKENIDHKYAAHLNSCVHCGLCSDSCHYYLTHEDIQSIPAHKLNLVISVFKRYFSFIGKILPRWVGARKLDKEMIREWVDSIFGRCSLCGRCSINCSIGLNIPYLMRVARSALTAIDLVPPGLQSTVDTAIEKGNNMGIAKDDWLETVEWIEEELQDDIDDPEARLPLDKEGATYFYAINPREAMFFPLSIQAVGKLFHAAGESWTFSGDNYDVTNYGLYIGDDKVAGLISDRLVQSMEKLGCQTMVLAECGHGFNSNRWEAPEWLSKKYGFEVKSILEVVADFIREGRIKLDPAKNQKPVTLHDPCNLVRLGGIIEEQRYILKHAVSHFIEMTPNRQKNFCCGGGGGQLAMTRFSQRRIKAGKVKADQIRDTGAKIVATPCHNCIDQLMELNKHYQLGVEIKTVCEIAADALIF
ncbi:MAG: (Fe-S)-binding protein [Candidatus Aminicenantes bacterium]|nr:(Fe-S)-binding protein [Candidatus Aminicenantes bacterium]NIM81445.1 (Fe-S)-binding protein [Candidatus Aminicenantes bacterium]NIN23170.1 (Fe-S)-binding protein [Candidatus Aminicenantes bacterium]NIN44631.1 (Fe-S)-binding protein [Candidatus Aminicenantes bacterium]NIN87447.1 (Fe-S)-binding protein [Candidatus Aminicenantes bacterium]